MSQEKNIETLISIIRISLRIPESAPVNADTLFSQIDSFDSMAAMNLQMDIVAVFGKGAEDVPPMAEMSISQYFDLINA